MSAHERYIQVSSGVVDGPNEEFVAVGRAGSAKKPNIFARIALFIRQVIAELRKVITPTRQELVKFTAVVLAFVVIMMGIVYGLDLLFALVVNAVFGIPR